MAAEIPGKSVAKKSEQGTAKLQMTQVMSRQLRSQMADEIVSYKPGFFIRWSSLSFLVALIMMVGACWYIRYPEVIHANARLTSINAPKPVVCLQQGKLIRLLAIEGQLVIKGQAIGYIESIADHSEVIDLERNLDSMQRLSDSFPYERSVGNFENEFRNLGELQPAYQQFAQALISFRNLSPNSFYDEKIDLINRDKLNLGRLHDILINQRVILEKDVTLAQQTLDSNELLNKLKVISDFDYRLEESKLLIKKMSLPQITAAIVNNEREVTNRDRELLELKNDVRQQLSIFSQAMRTFQSQISEWKRKYILSAPVNGKVVFSSFIQANQELQMNDVICYVNPDDTRYFAEVDIPQSNFGKVSLNQTVLLKFSSYPFQEYGSVDGRIEFINHIPTDKGYLAKVNLPGGLVTTSKRRVQYREGLLADAEIITRDTRLLERFYYEIMKEIRTR